MSLSIPGIVLFNTVWIKKKMSWRDALWLGICVADSPGCLPAPRAAPSPPAQRPGELHLARASPGRCGALPAPSRFLSLHKNSPNSEMQKAFPALQGGVGREGEHSPSAPSLFL